MMSYSALALLCLILPSADPVTAEELQIAVAALEERFSSHPVIEVEYRDQYEWKPGRKPRKDATLNSYTYLWLQKGSLQRFTRTTTDGKNKQYIKWCYDGKTTQEWNYDLGAGQPRDIAIWHAPPRPEIVICNVLALCLGHSIFGRDEGFADFLNSARKTDSLSATRAGSLLVIQLGKLTIDGGDSDIYFSIDAEHDYRVASWKLEQWDSEHKSVTKTECTIDEFQSVRDEATGKNIWFPSRVGVASRDATGLLEVTSVRINHDLPDDRFAHESPPFGTILREMSTVAGAAAKESIVGGEAAHQARVANLIEEARRETARLDETGVSFDATPKSNGVVRYWWGAAGLLLVVACLCWVFQRKS